MIQVEDYVSGPAAMSKDMLSGCDASAHRSGKARDIEGSNP
jgi:hypothetical protein